MLNLLEFVVHPEPFFYDYRKPAGLQDVNFPHDREFDRTFTVRGTDEAATRAVFTPAVIRFFREHPGIVLEGDGDRLLFYHSAKTLNPDELAVFLEEGKQATALIFEAVGPAA